MFQQARHGSRSVIAIQFLHPAREGWLRRFDEEAIVIRHQGVGMNAPLERLPCLGKESEEAFAIGDAEEDVSARHATVVEVPERARMFETEGTRQGTREERFGPSRCRFAVWGE